MCFKDDATCTQAFDHDATCTFAVLSLVQVCLEDLGSTSYLSARSSWLAGSNGPSKSEQAEPFFSCDARGLVGSSKVAFQAMTQAVFASCTGF